MGRYPAWERKPTIEDSHILSITALSRHGIVSLDGAASGTWTWDNGHNSLGYRRVGDILFLNYRTRGQDVAYSIKLDAIPLRWNNGSYRLCFICPNTKCQRRAYKLYSPPGGLYYCCRHCQNISYDSRLYHPDSLCYQLTVMYGRQHRAEAQLRPKKYGKTTVTD